jgi:hypothetical protein
MRKIERAILSDCWFHICFPFSGFNLDAPIGLRSWTYCRALRSPDGSALRYEAAIQFRDLNGQ